MKIAWTLLCRGRTDEFITSLRTHAPFVDRSILIIHGTDEENKGNLEFLRSEECKPWDIVAVRTSIPYDPKALRDLYMEQLDVYLDEVQDDLWFLITDSDEYLEMSACYTLRPIAVEAQKQGFNIIGFNSHDIQMGPTGDVWENKSGYWNPNFNRHYKGMRYTPGTHIGIARPAAVNMAKSEGKYYHVKTVGSQWLRGCRNYWTTAEVAQNTTNSPEWQEFKRLCQGHGLEEFDQMVALLQRGEVPEDLTQWFILNRNSENSEARSWFVVYYVYLHPELNVGLAGNRDYVYDKDRKPSLDLSY